MARISPDSRTNGPDLTGQIVVITGGARRIGATIALRMAESGADVAFTYLQSEAEAEKLVAQIGRMKRHAFAVSCDVTDERNVKEAIKEIEREMGGIDVLVNNAALYEMVPFEEITVAQWDRMFASNARGPFLVSRAALASLRKRQGRIINLGSLGGLRPWASHGHYCASKAALTMLSQVMAKALAPEISVNCVAPGMIDTGENPSSKTLKHFAEKTPMRRNGSNQDVADAVLYFATAPKFITGQTLVVDGGLSLA
jgi:NAD(P)-dependent dehydrogenase (short-subunit alcohol dehydrogenase family)